MFREPFRAVCSLSSSFFRVSGTFPGDWFPFFLFLSSFGHHSYRLVTLFPLSFMFRSSFRAIGYPTSSFFPVSVTFPSGWLPFFLFLSCFGHHSGRFVTFLPLSFQFQSSFRAIGYLTPSFFQVLVTFPGGWLPYFLFLSSFGNLSNRLVTFLPLSFEFRSSFRAIGYLSSSFFQVSGTFPNIWLPFFLFLSGFGHLSDRLVTLLPLSFQFR